MSDAGGISNVSKASARIALINGFFPERVEIKGRQRKAEYFPMRWIQNKLHPETLAARRFRPNLCCRR